MKIELFYDKECPFCNSYANYLKFKKSHELLFYNAREYSKEIAYFKTIGFDINNGYIIRVDQKSLYQGVDAMIFLNKLSQKRVFFYDNCFFRNVVYPFIKKLRIIILFLSKKSTSL